MKEIPENSLQIIIIEDEKPAAEKLAKSIMSIRPDWEIETILHNCADSVRWLRMHREADLIFMDIQLTDGLSFEIFEAVEISCPVIFVTAYDHYWQKAFAHNGIDYLLKPYNNESLALAIHNYDRIKIHFTSHLQNLLTWIKNREPEPPLQTRERFLLKRGMEYVKVETEDIAYFYATQKVVCLVTSAQGKFILDKSLTELAKELDSRIFFRVNRKFIINQAAIMSIKIWSKSKLKLELIPKVDEEVIVSQEQVANFKQWMGG